MINLDEINFEDEFIDTFTLTGGGVEECHCGKTHVAIESDYLLDLDEGNEMRDDFIKRAKTDENLELHYGVEAVYMVVINNEYVAECDCRGWEPYMKLFLNNKSIIAEFLIKVSAKVNLINEQYKTLNRLKDI